MGAKYKGLDLTPTLIMSLTYRELQSAYREFCEVHKVYQPALNRKKDTLQEELITLVNELNETTINDYGQAHKKADAIAIDDTIVNVGTVEHIEQDNNNKNWVTFTLQDGNKRKYYKSSNVPVLSDRQYESRCEFLVEAMRRHYTSYFSTLALHKHCMKSKIGTFTLKSYGWELDASVCIERLVQYHVGTYTYNKINEGIYTAVNSEQQIVPYFGSNVNLTHVHPNPPNLSSICLYAEGIALQKAHDTELETNIWLDFRSYEYVSCETVRLSYEFEQGKPQEFDCIETTYQLDVPLPVGSLLVKLATFHHSKLNLDYKRVTTMKADGSTSMLTQSISTDKSISAVDIRARGVKQCLEYINLSLNV